MWNLHIYHWASNFKQMQPYARNRWFLPDVRMRDGICTYQRARSKDV
jgi:hypothetical protein